MDELRTILVGVDFSPCSKAALKQAIRLARENDAKLCVFHAIQSLVITDLAEAIGRKAKDLEGEAVADARQELADLIGTDVDRDDVVLDLRVGAPLGEILEAVDRHHADLLVLGVCGASGHAHGAGTFATKCVRRARTKVLLVHESHTGNYRRVVACVDFAKTSERALAQAMRMAKSHGSQLTALHVYYGPWHKLHYRAPTPEASPAFQRQYMTRLQSLLEGLVESVSAQVGGVQCTAQLHEHPSYGRGIVEYLQSSRSDLVVMGTEGNANLRYMLLGSTAERVLRETPCSVLTIKPLKYSQPEE